MANSSLWLLKWLASGFGSGWLPKAPGTWGSLAALLPAWLILESYNLTTLWLATAVITLLGYIICYVLLPQLTARGEGHDPGWIVIDEWAGQWLCIAILLSIFPGTSLIILLPLAFVLFRGFDILKPFPIKTVETWGPDWLSIINDDLLAGIIGAAVGTVILWGLA